MVVRFTSLDLETLKIAKAEVEWNYPMDYQIALDCAIGSIETLDRLENLIPKDTPYCYTSLGWNAYENCHRINPCPYWDIKTVNDPQCGECEIEWCHYLGKELSVQDQVKDCGISVWEEE